MQFWKAEMLPKRPVCIISFSQDFCNWNPNFSSISIAEEILRGFMNEQKIHMEIKSYNLKNKM